MSRQEIKTSVCYNGNDRWFSYMILEARRGGFPVCDCCKDNYTGAVPYYKSFAKERMQEHLAGSKSWPETARQMQAIGRELGEVKDTLGLEDLDIAKALGVDVHEIQAIDMGFLLDQDFPYPQFRDDYIHFLRVKTSEQAL